MKTLPRIIAPAIAATLAISALSAPASAATRHVETRTTATTHVSANHSVRNDIRTDIARLDRSIDRALAQHRISSREARTLRQRVDALEVQYRRSARNGMTRSEVASLQNRIDNVQFRLAKEMRDSNRYAGNAATGRTYVAINRR